MEATREQFEALVADALDNLPPSLGKMMDNVAVMVEQWPSSEQLEGVRGTLLGRYEGIDLTRRSPLWYQGAMPDRIFLFQGPISQRSANAEDMEAMVRRTLIHEVAHHFGISDARLTELGWG